MSFPTAHWPEWNFRVSPPRFFFVLFSEDWARLIWPCLSPVTEADAQTVRQSLQNDVQVHDARPAAAMRGASLQAHPDGTDSVKSAGGPVLEFQRLQITYQPLLIPFIV